MPHPTPYNRLCFLLLGMLIPSTALLAIPREKLPKDKRLSPYWANFTYYTQMSESNWPAGDGDKPRIQDPETFVERIQEYRNQPPEILNRLQTHQVHWEIARKVSDPTTKSQYKIAYYTEYLLREMGLLVSEASYISATGGTMFQDHYRRESWLLTRCKDTSYSRKAGQAYLENYMSDEVDFNGMDVVKGYYNAVTYDLDGYKKLGRSHPLLKRQFKAITRQHEAQSNEINDLTRLFSRRADLAADELIANHPDFVGLDEEVVRAAIVYKGQIERIRKLLILNVRTEAKVAELLASARHWRFMPWDPQGEVVLPNLNPETEKAYKVEFEPIYPGQDPLELDCPMDIKPYKKHVKMLKKQKRKEAKKAATSEEGSSVTHESEEQAEEL
ncbi:MAG: hypothetical protein OXT67_02670 [Zetaproteobacteria bacterium]|nr:hypothetical protein [Zetaproteobacteria bacterium]